MERQAVIVTAVRTPVGRIGGVLSPVQAGDLGAVAVREAVNRAGLDSCEIDDIVMGNLYNAEMTNAARYISLSAGLPMSVPAVTLDRGCASSLNAAGYAMAMIESGHEKIILAGGAESDSNRPWIMRKPKKWYQTQPPEMMLSGISAPGELGVSMGITAENVAKKYGITRAQADAFALDSQRKAAAAVDQGYFREQIVPVEVKRKKQEPLLVLEDECVRRDSSMEGLARLKPSFIEDGVVTAGNSSPMSDGASALIMMERKTAEEKGYSKMYRFRDFASAGVDPRLMGEGPIEAIRKLFKRNGLTWSDIDLVEINEAFATQSVACIRELNIPIEKFNVNGGAIALGHPLAATGGILIAKLIAELDRRDLSTGVVSFCLGGGQGSAAFIERIR